MHDLTPAPKVILEYRRIMSSAYANNQKYAHKFA